MRLAASVAALPRRLALLLGLLAALALVGPWLTPHSAAALDLGHAHPAPPALRGAHWLGTDALGRDAYARLIAGYRVSLGIALGSAAVSVAIGAAVGIGAGLAGGWRAQFLLRLVELMAVVPQVFVVILVSFVLGRGPAAVLIGLVPLGWLPVARVLYAATAELARQPYIEAARASGVPPPRLLTRHVLPNLRAPLLTSFTVAVPQFVLTEGFVSFLGLGVQDPGASLGLLLGEAGAALDSAPWLLAGPAALLATLVFTLNALADRQSLAAVR